MRTITRTGLVAMGVAVLILATGAGADADARKGGHYVGGYGPHHRGGHEIGGHAVHHPLRALLRRL